MPVTSSISDAKDRQYAQLARNLKQLAAVAQEGAELFNLLGVDLHAMALLSAHHGAQFIATGEMLEEEHEQAQRADATTPTSDN